MVFSIYVLRDSKENLKNGLIYDSKYDINNSYIMFITLVWTHATASRDAFVVICPIFFLSAGVGNV